MSGGLVAVLRSFSRLSNSTVLHVTSPAALCLRSHLICRTPRSSNSQNKEQKWPPFSHQSFHPKDEAAFHDPAFVNHPTYAIVESGEWLHSQFGASRLILHGRSDLCSLYSPIPVNQPSVYGFKDPSRESSDEVSRPILHYRASPSSITSPTA